ncbi:MAG: 2-amino-4-hydroxy-6-hydroxymethyldihydropteridine diphosphokinase [Aquiluna sp.]
MTEPHEAGWHRVVVALGSNMGERDDELFMAIADLRATEGVRIVAESSVHETVALTKDGYDEKAPKYLNQVVLIDTVWSPEDLLRIVLEVEARHGRVRSGERYESRTLDIDLIDYDNEPYAAEGLELPHPRAHERRFVLEPWSEVDPEAVIPGHGSVATLLAGLA